MSMLVRLSAASARIEISTTVWRMPHIYTSPLLHARLQGNNGLAKVHYPSSRNYPIAPSDLIDMEPLAHWVASQDYQRVGCLSSTQSFVIILTQTDYVPTTSSPKTALLCTKMTPKSANEPGAFVFLRRPMSHQAASALCSAMKGNGDRHGPQTSKQQKNA